MDAAGRATEERAATVRNPWLRHVFPGRSHGPGMLPELALDAVQVDIERVMASVANGLAARRGIPHGEASAMAANILMAEGIGLQRERSPRGYVSMIGTLFLEDPLTDNLRAEFRDRMLEMTRAAIRRAFLKGILAGIWIAAGVIAFFRIAGW